MSISHTITYPSSNHTPQGSRPRDQGQPRTLSDRHRHMLEVESGISREVIAQRGPWTAYTAADLPPGFAASQRQARMFPILVIPQWNTVGRQAGYVLRPDHPRLDDDGKPIKYESQPGGPVGFDCPPSMRHLLRDSTVPLYITEGSKKADAAASHGLLCLSLNGVYGFLHKRLVVSELDEIALNGRDVRIVFDSDVMTKTGVADALNRIAGAVDRRGGHVGMVQLAMGDEGAKVGLDDHFAAGGQPANLDTLTRPWAAVRRPRNLVEYADPYAKIEQLQADNATLVKTLTTPHAKEKQKMALSRFVSIAMSKASRGEDMDDLGRVRVSAREIANDWRGREDKRAPVNPDGSAFLMDRDSVHGLLKELRDDLHVLSFTPTTVSKSRAANGLPYNDTEFLIDPPASIAEALGPISTYAPDVPKERPYRRQDPCIYCGEVHPRKVVCMGCDKTVKVLPVPAANDPNATEEQRRDLEERTAARETPTVATDEQIDIETGEILKSNPIAGNFPAMKTTYKGSPSPAPVNYSAGNFPAMDDEPERVAPEPVGLWDVPPDEDIDENDPYDLPFMGYVASPLNNEPVSIHDRDIGTDVCRDCGVPVPAGRMWPRCGPCIEAARVQAEADLARGRAERAGRLGVAS